MEGISFNQGADGALLFVIESLSDDLKKEIRKKLSAICHGAAKAASKSELYAYKITLNEFLKRYNSKSDNIKKGMIGELLTHILFIHFLEKYTSVNPYFNMEEESIKKAFDLVLRNSETGELWFTEVKSGERGKQSGAQKTSSLLNTAKSELKEKLDSSRFALWQNAINGAEIAVQATKIKDQIREILEGCNLNAVNQISESINYNAIIVSVLYNCLSDRVEIATVDLKHKEMLGKKEFKNLLTFAIQKHTYHAVAAFLHQEAADA